jgi:MFS transporter, DHA3 family, multidrug efflux protein
MARSKNIRTFYALLVNSLIAGVTNYYLWFAVTFWAYLETRSVIATSIIGGAFMVISAIGGLFFGTFVDHHKKKAAMLYSSIASFVSFGLAGLVYALSPRSSLLHLSGPAFWAFVILVLIGAVVGNLRTIALSTTVTMLVPERMHDRANGWIGTATGISFAVVSVFSGMTVGLLGMDWALGIAVLLSIAVLLHLLTITVTEKQPAIHATEAPKHFDFHGTLRAIKLVPGLMALIFFATFNNFLGGVYMSLMDAYGLNLVSVETWGLLWGVISFGFIFGGIAVVRFGLGASPLRTLFLCNIVMWAVSIGFTIKPWIALLTIGMLIYMMLIPIVEASEQTIIQKVVPLERQGRVFGFAQSVESAASPLTAFLIGPIAQLFFIPFMTDGTGAERIGSWFGTGPDRGIALVFILAGCIGLIVTIVAFRSRAFKVLDASYAA